LEVAVVNDAVVCGPVAATVADLGFVAAWPMLEVPWAPRRVGTVRAGPLDVRRRGSTDVVVRRDGFDAAGAAVGAPLVRFPPAAMIAMMTTAMAAEITTFFTSVSFDPTSLR